MHHNGQVSESANKPYIHHIFNKLETYSFPQAFDFREDVGDSFAFYWGPPIFHYLGSVPNTTPRHFYSRRMQFA